MPPKKEADSKKKKGATAGGSADLTPEDQIKLLKVTIDSLQVQLADRSEETSRAIHAKDDVVDKMKGLSKALDEERQSKLDLLESMTRDMKESELEFLSQLKIKEADISKANEILLEQERQFKDDLNVKETTIAKKDIEIRVLNETIMKQRNEFNATLKTISLRLASKLEVSRSKIATEDLSLELKIEEIIVSVRNELNQST